MNQEDKDEIHQKVATTLIEYIEDKKYAIDSQRQNQQQSTVFNTSRYPNEVINLAIEENKTKFEEIKTAPEEPRYRTQTEEEKHEVPLLDHRTNMRLDANDLLENCRAGMQRSPINTVR